MITTCVDDDSGTAATMQATTDPYPSDVISLSTNLQGEIRRIRYVLDKITGWSQWYTHTEAFVFPNAFRFSSVGPNAIGGATSADVSLLIRGTGAAGQAMGVQIDSVTTPATTESSYGLNVTPTLTEFSSGLHPNLAGINVEPTVTAGVGTLTTLAAIRTGALTAQTGTTNAAAIYVSAAPTGATTNYAIWVDGGTVQLDGALDVDGAATFDGAVTLGNATGDNITVTGTVTSNLIFTDNTYDIGASGATRPRNLFLSGNATIGGSAEAAGIITSKFDASPLPATIIRHLDSSDNVLFALKRGGTGDNSLFIRSFNEIGFAPNDSDTLAVNITPTSLVVSGVGPHSFGGATNTLYQLGLLGTFNPSATAGAALSVGTTLTLASGEDAYGIRVAPTFTEFTSGVHALLAGIHVAPTITNDAATATTAAGISIATFAAGAGTTNAAGLYISAAPTGATTNNAIWVDAGNVLFDANLRAESIGVGVAASGAAGRLTVNENLIVGGTFNVAGVTTLDGAVTLGNTTGDNITVTGTVTSNLIFTDNTYDIGASGATRPRDLYFSGLFVGGGMRSTAAGLTFINDTSNANMTIGLTINQGAADNTAFALKSTDIAHGLSTATLDVSATIDVETDDYFTIQKYLDGATGGGTMIRSLGESGISTALEIQAYGGASTTTDTTSSVGGINLFHAAHDDANALVVAAANANLFTIQSYSGAGARTTRLLLKADDGELHLGNTTLVALDHHNDVQLVRAFERFRSGGRGLLPSRHEDGTYDKAALQRIGVLGGDNPENPSAGHLFSVQGLLRLQSGALWQLYVSQREQGEDFDIRVRDLERENHRLRARLDTLEQGERYAGTRASGTYAGRRQSVLGSRAGGAP